MSIFDIFRKRKPIPTPWSKYYTDDELDIKIPNISLYKQNIFFGNDLYFICLAVVYLFSNCHN